MASVAALYYPHTQIRSPRLLKTALLLWAHVECIVPRRGEERERRTREIEKAEALIVRRRVPSSAHKQQVQAALGRILQNGVPAWTHAAMAPHGRPYLMYPDKLDDETWRLLVSHGLASRAHHLHVMRFRLPLVCL